MKFTIMTFVFLVGLAMSPMGFAMGGKKSADPSQSSDSIWITRSDGARGCELGSGQTLEAGAEQLKTAQVHVLQSRKVMTEKCTCRSVVLRSERRTRI